MCFRCVQENEKFVLVDRHMNILGFHYVGTLCQLANSEKSIVGLVQTMLGMLFSNTAVDRIVFLFQTK